MVDSPKTGTLFVVATPIGNMEDLTPRAARVLGEVELIAAEDTRTTGRLLQRIGLRKPLISLFRQNTARRVEELLALLRAGKSVAIVSESGTPVVSDPGVEVVKAAHEAGFPVRTIPGPSAVTAALSASGFPADHFTFAGFLPRKRGKRQTLLRKLSATESTVVLFESPYRLVETLRDILEVFGDVEIALCREMTKLHEEIRRGAVSAIVARFSAITVRGEIVVVIGGTKSASLPGEGMIK
ncbi:MAG: 16S rRNA (cytidine(1402)-2'-O)-methyltransferase [Planctomycetes bacterium RBG_16_59_8]|nr:MAG: 16S rRNA (cytidine(1402)-2'-O)-methyltransferase [Planctomycetes bacterium RBG_16_59_8]